MAAMKLSIYIEIHHFMVSGERVCLSVTCLQRGGESECVFLKKKRGAGLGSLFRVSLQPRSGVSFSPFPPLRAAGPRSGNKTG